MSGLKRGIGKIKIEYANADIMHAGGLSVSDIIRHMEGRQMPNVHLTKPMQAYVKGRIKSGAYANMSEVVRAGIRLLMQRDGARQFYAMKADLEHAARDAEAGAFDDFDPQAYEPDAYRIIAPTA